nr:M50 family metallopeptidase [Spelaeicoccus albus]
MWDRAVTAQAAPEFWVAAAMGVVALAIVMWRPVWRVSRHPVTIAHEASHGVVALVSGRRLSGIRLHSDTSGVTVSRGHPRGAGMVFTCLAGYLGPSAIGLAAAATVHAGYITALLYGMLVLLALMLIQIRNWFGLWSVFTTGAVIFFVTWLAPVAVHSAFAALIAWFLLLAAPRAVYDLVRARRGGRERDSDADQLARLTHLPAFFWLGTFWLITAAVLVCGGSLLL